MLPFRLRPGTHELCQLATEDGDPGWPPPPPPHRGDTGLVWFPRWQGPSASLGVVPGVTAPCTAALSGSPARFSWASPGRGSGCRVSRAPPPPIRSRRGSAPRQPGPAGLEDGHPSSAPCPRPEWARAGPCWLPRKRLSQASGCRRGSLVLVQAPLSASRGGGGLGCF